MIKVDKGFIAYQQAVAHQIRSFNNGTFPCVSVVVSIMFDNYQTFANFVEIYMHIKAKT